MVEFNETMVKQEHEGLNYFNHGKPPASSECCTVQKFYNILRQIF